MKKRLFASILIAALTAASFASCGGSGNSSSTSSGSESQTSGSSAAAESDSSDEAPYAITMAYLGGSEQPDYQEVMDAINELTMKELNMTFEGVQLGFGDFTDKLRLMLTGGDKLDVLFTFATQASAYVSQNLVINLLDYNGTNLMEEYGQGIVDAIGEEQAYGGQINGVLYGIPSQKEAMGTAGIVMRKDIVDELGIDPSGWSTYDDLNETFAKVHEAHPELNVVTGANMVTKFYPYDSLNDSFGVLMMEDPDNLNWM